MMNENSPFIKLGFLTKMLFLFSIFMEVNMLQIQ